MVGKSIKLAVRSRRRFIAFLLMYTALMTWMSINLDFVVRKLDAGDMNGWADWQLLVLHQIFISTGKMPTAQKTTIGR